MLREKIRAVTGKRPCADLTRVSAAPLSKRSVGGLDPRDLRRVRKAGFEQTPGRSQLNLRSH